MVAVKEVSADFTVLAGEGADQEITQCRVTLDVELLDVSSQAVGGGELIVRDRLFRAIARNPRIEVVERQPCPAVD